MAYRILNPEPGPSSEASASPQIAARLMLAIRGLEAGFFDAATGRVDYAGLVGSPAYAEYRAATAQLRDFDPNGLQGQDQRLAFWINLYNALNIHGIIALGVTASVREVPHFFATVAYQVGPYALSLDEIEHGILRRNQKKHLLVRAAFASRDPRLALILPEPEPRIHFALVCGARSCPPIASYQAERIQAQLDSAASAFINSEQVRLDPDRKKVYLSKIFAWYGRDFGKKAELLRFIAAYRHDPAEAAWLSEQAGAMSISWLDYDWGLNR